MNKNNNIAIRLTNISKRYTIHHEKPTLVEKIMKTAKWQKDEQFWALRDINLEIKKGERLGIIGPNGSGKTTLLKIIAGITTPTTGKVETHGRIVSLIDLEAGFHPDLTGIQNIYLNGMLLGMAKSEIDGKIKKIISFADIDRFIDAPMFTYSAGMILRLGFSVAIHSDPDILILDEGLSVGDMNFRQKSLSLIQKLQKAKIIIVTWQDIGVLQHLSDRVLIIENGLIQNAARETMIWAIRQALSHNHKYSTVEAASNSMAPAIIKGAKLTIQKLPFHQIKQGMIIGFTFPNLPELIIHRVSDILKQDGKTICITKGDNSFGYDNWAIKEENYLGVIIKISNKTTGL